MIQKYHKPRYDLVQLQELSKRSQTRHITIRAGRNAVALGFININDIVEVILNLTADDFVKSNKSLKAEGTWQDVYKKTWQGLDLYIKLQENPRNKVVIISFHLDN